MADMLTLGIIVVYMAGMLLMSEAFLRIAAVLKFYHEKNNRTLQSGRKNAAQKNLAFIIVGSTGFIFIGIFYVYNCCVA